MNLLRKLAGAVTIAFVPVLAGAQAYPAKPVRLIAPFAAGTAPDGVARELATELAKHLGQTVYVDNRPGASGTIASEAAAKSPADGYTLFLGATSSLSIVPELYSKLSYNAEKDFTPVSLIGAFQTGLIANPHVPAKTAVDIVDLLKKKPGSINAGTQGVGTYTHLNALWFGFATDTKPTVVPYNSNSPYADLMGGQVEVMFDGLSAALGGIQAGKLKLLGITGKSRHPAFPDTPTFAELGIKEYTPIGWFGLLAPAGTPKAVVDRLAAAIKLIPSNAEFVKRYTQYGGEVICNTPAEFEAFVKQDRAMWRSVIKRAGLRLD